MRSRARDAPLQLRFVVGCDPARSFRRCAASRRARLRASRGARAIAPMDGRPVSTRTSVGALGAAHRSRRPPARRPPCCPISVDRCPTIASPMCSVCPRSGCRTPIRRARSTRRTSTCSPTSPRRAADHDRAVRGPAVAAIPDTLTNHGNDRRRHPDTAQPDPRCPHSGATTRCAPDSSRTRRHGHGPDRLVGPQLLAP